METLIKEIFDLQKKKKDLESNQEKLKQDISSLDIEISEKQKDLLSKMKESDSKEIDLGDIVATTFSKENIAYRDEKEVLNYLKNNNYVNLITTKTTESLNKNNLKKALKTDEELKKALESMTIKTLTE